MKRAVLSVTVRDEAAEPGVFLFSGTKSVWNAALRASEQAVGDIARSRGTIYEGEKPVVIASRWKSEVGDEYVRRWIGRDGNVLVAIVRIEQRKGEGGRDPSSASRKRDPKSRIPVGGATHARTLPAFKRETAALLETRGTPKARAKRLVRAHTADVKRAWKRRQPPCAATDTIVREEKAGMHGKRDPGKKAEKCEAFADDQKEVLSRAGGEVRLTKKPRARHVARTIAKSIGRKYDLETYLQCPSEVVTVHKPAWVIKKEIAPKLTPRGLAALAGLGAVAVLAAVGDPGHPKPKFKLGDSVVRDDGMKGVVSFIGAYDDFLKQYRYKVQEESGARIHWNEGTMRKIPKRTSRDLRSSGSSRPPRPVQFEGHAREVTVASSFHEPLRVSVRDPKDKFDIFKISSMGGKKTHVSGPHAWTVAWRKAAKLNDEAREAFKTGRTMYDVPEYVVEKRGTSRDFGSFALGAAVGAGGLYAGQRIMKRPKAKAVVRLGRIKTRRAAKSGARGVGRSLTAWGSRDPGGSNGSGPKSGRRTVAKRVDTFSETMFEANEIARFRKELAQAGKGASREEKAAFAEALAHEPELVAERIDWILAGNYGQGAYLEARKVIRSRMNAPAWLTQTVGALEWMVPFESTRKSWNALTASQKANLAREVDKVIARNLRSED